MCDYRAVAVLLLCACSHARRRCSYIHPILQQALGTKTLNTKATMQGKTSAARIISDNLDYRERGGLRLADALRIHAALHDPNAPSVTISTGHVLPIDSGGETGVRRCHVVVDAERPRGRWAALSNALSWQPPGSSRLCPCARGGLWAPEQIYGHLGHPGVNQPGVSRCFDRVYTGPS